MISRVGLFTAHRPRGFKWYVDSVNGNDTNSGKSPATAFRTISAATSHLGAGDSIGLARGSQWREQFTLPAANIMVGAYGSGNRPLLDASDAIATGDWSKTAGSTVTYQASEPHDIATGKTFIRVWENGALLKYQTSVALVDANPRLLHRRWRNLWVQSVAVAHLRQLVGWFEPRHQREAVRVFAP